MTAKRLAPLLAALAAAPLVWLWAAEPDLRGSGLLADSDYMEYAAAARLFVGGGDPYHPPALFDLQRQYGTRRDYAHMMWNPPWALAVVAPLAAVPWFAGQLLWAYANLAAVAASAALLWPRLGGRPGRVWLAVALAVAFGPTVVMVRLTQVSGLMLFGLAGFVAWRGRRPALAGLCLALTAVKPHLLLPFALLLALDALRSRPSRASAIYGTLVLLAASAAVTAWRPTVWADYRAAVNAPSGAAHVAPGDWAPPILSYRLRTAFDWPLWTQFAPSVVASAALAAYWWRRRERWDWAGELPVVVLVCLTTTGYGAWAFDAVLLLPAVLTAAARVDRHGSDRLKFYAAGGFLVASAMMFSVALPVVAWAPLAAAAYAAALRLGPPS